MTLREWLQVEFDKAREAARANRGSQGGNLGQHKHCSAVSRMCALGEVIAHLGKAEGGYIQAPGTDRSDLVPFMLSPGEEITTRERAEELGLGAAWDAQHRSADNG